MGKYDEIIDHEYPFKSRHERMSREERAAQFSPFAALTGYEDVIKEEARVVDEMPILSEDQKERMDKRLQNVEKEGIQSVITYFEKDANKPRGGKIVTERALIKEIKKEKRCIILDNGKTVYFENLIDII